MRTTKKRIIEHGLFVLLSIFLGVGVVVANPTELLAREEIRIIHLDEEPVEDSPLGEDAESEEYSEEEEEEESNWFGEKVVEIYDVKISVFGKEVNFGNIADSVNSFISFTDIQSFGNGMYNTILSGISGSTKSLGIAIATLMILWEFFKEGLEIGGGANNVTWERLAMLFVRFGATVLLISYSVDILTRLAGLSVELMNTATGGVQDSTVNIGTALETAMTGDAGTLGKIAIFAVAIMLIFPYYGTAISVLTLVFVRILKVIVAIAFAPIPIGLSVGNFRQQDAMRYFFWAFGVLIQAPIIRLGTNLYSMMLSSLGQSVGSGGIGDAIALALGICVCNGVLAASIHMSEQVTQRLIS